LLHAADSEWVGRGFCCGINPQMAVKELKKMAENGQFLAETMPKRA
jgi:hypothetical protein